jgi:hypothetical protein
MIIPTKRPASNVAGGITRLSTANSWVRKNVPTASFLDTCPQTVNVTRNLAQQVLGCLPKRRKSVRRIRQKEGTLRMTKSLKREP